MHRGDLLHVATFKPTLSPMKGKLPDPATDEGVVHRTRPHASQTSPRCASPCRARPSSLVPTPVQQDCGPHLAHPPRRTAVADPHAPLAKCARIHLLTLDSRLTLYHVDFLSLWSSVCQPSGWSSAAWSFSSRDLAVFWHGARADCRSAPPHSARSSTDQPFRSARVGTGPRPPTPDALLGPRRSCC